MKHTAVFVWGLIAALVSMDRTIAEAQEYRSSEPLPLFSQSSVLQLKLRTDFSKLLGKRYGYGTNKLAREFQPVSLELLGDESQNYLKTVNAVVSGRGALRGNECRFPQLKIDFENRQQGKSLFRGLKELKMVTHCGISVTGRQVDFDEMIRMEYLVYRMRQEAFDLSFHARLLKVTYEDTSGTIPPITAYGIFIEDVSDLAKRMQVARVYNPAQVEARPELSNLMMRSMTDVQPYLRARLKLFQVMIGNTDYAWGHNLKGIFGPYGFDVIPYDFDYADIFFGSLHRHDLYLNTEPLTCLSTEDAKAVVGELADRRDRIMSLIAKTDLIAPQTRDMALESLSLFFSRLDNVRIQTRAVTTLDCVSDM